MVQEAKKAQLIKCRIVVIGSGPAGMLAALKLASLYGEIILIGPQTDSNDMRTTALMMPAIYILEKLGIWADLKAHAAPLATMRIIDGTEHLIRSPVVSFHATEIGEETFGYNIPNIALNGAIAAAVKNCRSILRVRVLATAYHHDKHGIEITLADNSIINTALLVAADGRTSTARDAAEIRTRQWYYPQTAITLSFSHQLPHYNISTEFHTAEGPFTQVPLLGNRSSLVWLLKSERARRLLSLTSKAVSREIEEHMKSMLGKVNVDTAIQAWPIGGILPKTFAANRTILIGEAAHIFPPIGAQGLNLSIRDVTDLAAAISINTADPGAENVIRYYNRYRKLDIWATTGFIHTLNCTLLSDSLPIQLLRSAGLEILRQFSPFRTFFMYKGMYG
ncbi:MAG: 2-octaprenyl-6-methoxyphenol hydroxylase [Candidatus Tokpelaia sp. JSC189]|nr:MAG: 2-octaprenyl-6-methoxyphenol hydroxylase [Candidatus Tokpelaia sp. JSC189]